MNLADYLVWLGHYYSQARAMKRVFLIHRASYISMFVTFAFLATVVGHPLIAGLFVALAAATWMIMPRFVIARALRMVRRMMLEDEEPFGPASLTLSEDALTLVSTRLETRFKLSTIQRIDRKPSGTYIYYSSLNALIIPSGKISEGMIEEFVQALEESRAGAQVGRKVLA